MSFSFSYFASMVLHGITKFCKFTFFCKKSEITSLTMQCSVNYDICVTHNGQQKEQMFSLHFKENCPVSPTIIFYTSLRDGRDLTLRRKGTLTNLFLNCVRFMLWNNENLTPPPKKKISNALVILPIKFTIYICHLILLKFWR